MVLEKSMECYHLPREMDYMLTLAVDGTASRIPEDMDWEKFLKYTAKNRLEALAAEGARKAAELPEVIDSLERRKQALSFQTMRQIQILAELMGVFQREGLRVISMKGPLLAAELYGDPALRYSNDLDLLVSEGEFPAAKKLLLEAGFEEYVSVFHKTEKLRQRKAHMGEEMHEVFCKDGMFVELHWRISFRYPVDFEELWERKEIRTLLGQPINYIGRQDNLIYLICHAAGHGYARLRWLLDLYEIFRSDVVRFAELYRQMEEKEVAPFLLESLLLLYLIPQFRMPAISNNYFAVRRENGQVHIFYDPAIKANVLRALLLLRLLYPLLIRDADPTGIADRNYQHMLPVIGRKNTVLTYLYKIIQPQRAELERFNFPDSLYFLYYIVRPFYKLWRYTPFYKGTHS